MSRITLRMELLEDRTVPTLTVGPVYAALSDGRIVITGTNGADSCSITSSSSDDTYTVKCNGITESFSASAVWRGEVVFWGRDGNDTFVNWGAPLHVRAYGERGDDLLIGGEEDDTLYGGEGHDELWGMGDNDTLHGEAGNDTLKGQDGTDHLEGGDNDDVLLGGKNGTSTEYLLGGRGNDYLAGEDGADHLDGLDGTDTLDGGAGDDVLESKLADC